MISPRSRRRTAAAGVLVAGALFTTAACGSGGSSAGASAGSAASPGTSGASGTRHATVLLDWDPNPDHLALYSALDNGDYRRAGLDVTLQPPSDPADPVKLVSAGKVDLGISYEPEVVIAAAEKLDVIAVGALIPTALNSIMAVGSAHITKPADLAGATIGTSGLQTDDAFLDAIFKANHIDSSSVRRVDVGSDLLPAMISKKVDATLGGYRNVEGVTLTDRGLAPKIIPVTAAGVPQYDELVVIARRSRLATDPAYAALVRGFLSATAQGNATALADPTKAGEHLAGVAAGTNPKLLAKEVAATAPLLVNPKGFGRMDVGAWASFARWMRTEGLIKTEVPAADVVTDAYLPKP